MEKILAYLSRAEECQVSEVTAFKDEFKQEYAKLASCWINLADERRLFLAEVGLRKPGNIQIDNRKGDVQISIPPNTPVKIEARTREGEIESDFDEIKVENSDNQSSASGSIGVNGPSVVVNCEKGTIGIRKATVAPLAPTPPARPAKPARALPAPKAAPVESEN